MRPIYEFIARLSPAVLVLTCGCAQRQPTAFFEGDSLAGWSQHGGKAGFAIKGGEVVGYTAADSPNTFLCSDAHYADFELEYEFKVDPRLNSGVQIRSNRFPGYAGGVVHGYQVEIDPSDRAFTAGIYDEERRGWLARPPQSDAERRSLFKRGDWNHVRVVAQGDLVRTWLNGKPVVELRDAMTRRGFVALQVHSTDSKEPLEVRWRNIKFKDLGDSNDELRRKAKVLLGGEADVAEWTRLDKPGEPIAWKWIDGALEVTPGSGNIVTRDAFGDCRIHIEFAVDDNGKAGQANGNSGVYVQQRYEVQILNSAAAAATDDNCGAIYKVKPADFNCALPAGEWQTYDIEFRAARWNDKGEKTANARMRVWHNGTRIHDNVELPKQTGAGQPEGPGDGPLMLQDHGNRIRFRNVWVAGLRSDE
ncbi:MAG: DUF1080 domain-containing protein [Phycisphaerae bacterium]